MSIDWIGPAIFGLTCVVGLVILVVTEVRFRHRLKCYGISAQHRQHMIDALLWNNDPELLDEMWRGPVLTRHVDALVRGDDWHDAYPDEIWAVVRDYEARVARSKITVVK